MFAEPSTPVRALADGGKHWRFWGSARTAWVGPGEELMTKPPIPLLVGALPVKLFRSPAILFEEFSHGRIQIASVAPSPAAPALRSGKGHWSSWRAWMSWTFSVAAWRSDLLKVFLFGIDGS